MTIEAAFKKFEILAIDLFNAVSEYAKCFSNLDYQEIAEKYLKEKISEKEKIILEEKIAKLEIRIEKLYEDLLNHTNKLIKILDTENIIDFSLINTINFAHLNTFVAYEDTIKIFNLLKDHYKEYDFDAVVDFSKMEIQKKKLNNQIVKFNQKFLKNATLKLLSVYECEKEIRQITLEQKRSFKK